MSVNGECDFFFQAEDGIRDLVRSRGLGDVYKRQPFLPITTPGRAEKIVMRALRAGRSISTRDTAAFLLSLIHI